MPWLLLRLQGTAAAGLPNSATGGCSSWRKSAACLMESRRKHVLSRFQSMLAVTESAERREWTPACESNTVVHFTSVSSAAQQMCALAASLRQRLRHMLYIRRTLRACTLSTHLQFAAASQLCVQRIFAPSGRVVMPAVPLQVARQQDGHRPARGAAQQDDRLFLSWQTLQYVLAILLRGATLAETPRGP